MFIAIISVTECALIIKHNKCVNILQKNVSKGGNLYENKKD